MQLTPQQKYGYIIDPPDAKEGDECLNFGYFTKCSRHAYGTCNGLVVRRKIEIPAGYRLLGLDETPTVNCKTFSFENEWVLCALSSGTIRQSMEGYCQGIRAVICPLQQYPRYWLDVNCKSELWRQNYEGHTGQCYQNRKWGNDVGDVYAVSEGFKEITAEEADKLIQEQNFPKYFKSSFGSLYRADSTTDGGYWWDDKNHVWVKQDSNLPIIKFQFKEITAGEAEIIMKPKFTYPRYWADDKGQLWKQEFEGHAGRFYFSSVGWGNDAYNSPLDVYLKTQPDFKEITAQKAEKIIDSIKNPPKIKETLKSISVQTSDGNRVYVDAISDGYQVCFRSYEGHASVDTTIKLRSAAMDALVDLVGKIKASNDN